MLTGHRERSGLIKQSLCVLASLDIKMLSTSTVFTLTQLSQRAYCVRERKEKQKKQEEGKQKRSCKWQGTNGSYQKMRLEWLAGLKVVTFI